MSESEFDRCDRELLKKCVAVFDAETKPLTRKPGKYAVKIMAIDRRHDVLNMARLYNDDTSDLAGYLKDYD